MCGDEATLKRIKKICVNSLREMRTIFPAFFVATLIGVLLEFFIPESIIYTVLGKDPFLSIVLATILGIILPIPRYATYPLAFTLMTKGAGIGVVFALISGEVICESVARDIVEVKYFGTRFFIARLVLSILFIIAGGFIMEVLL